MERPSTPVALRRIGTRGSSERGRLEPFAEPELGALWPKAAESG